MALEVEDVTDVLLAHRLIAGVKLHLEALCVQQKQQDFTNPDPPNVLGIMGAGWRQVTPEQDPPLPVRLWRAVPGGTTGAARWACCSLGGVAWQQQNRHGVAGTDGGNIPWATRPLPGVFPGRENPS